jgi:phage terminase large subunit-like protein
LGVAGRVYNLQVADSRTYFANGVLVHNCDEIAVWADAHRGDALDTTWNNALLGLRLGKRPEVVATSTPRRVKLVQELLKNPKCVVTHATTYDNLANLTPVFKELILGKYEGTRLEGQEIKGKLLEDVEGALWTEGIILRGPRPELARVVVAVDPSGSKTGDEIGIVGAGRTLDSGYVLEDRSGHYSPEGWGRAVVNLYHDLQADKVIAEANYGGEMVAHVIRTVDLTVPVKIIHASRGKAVRAEPVAAMYEQGKWTHCGVFPLLEDEMTTWTPDDPTSPNRLDALVWCGHELFLEKRRARALG